MRTIADVLGSLRACKKAIEKYSDSRAFKTEFINCHHSYGHWVGVMLFDEAEASSYPALPSRFHWLGIHYSFGVHVVDSPKLGVMFRKKANRIKYWPEVKKRLIEIGVKF